MNCLAMSEIFFLNIVITYDYGQRPDDNTVDNPHLRKKPLYVRATGLLLEYQ